MLHFQPATVCDLTPEEAAYIAGVWDGEGSIQLTRRRRRSKTGKEKLSLRVSVANTSEELVRWLRTRLGSVSIVVRQGGTNKKPCYVVNLYRIPDIEKLLAQIRPYLIVKAKQADLLLRYCAIRRGANHGEHLAEELNMVQELKVLNRRGAS